MSCRRPPSWGAALSVDRTTVPCVYAGRVTNWPLLVVYTLRAGTALRLTLHTGRTVTITVPDPHAAAAIVHEAKSA